ncbi:MAG TPA: aminotransferase class I/II-fold pyridoxal phosphate-dependent enzyme [Gemmatimonadaceae bacterium]|nr:aminotransferase class I/II-fold pyridoxal phosphate-dependent enzyme [Gemmatimonadaceae bacterium]
MIHPSPSPTARRTATFTESVIREMTRIANQHGAINLAQGFPDFAMPEAMKEAACAAIQGDVNQYAITWGSPTLRRAIAEKYRRWYGVEVDPEREITVTCGATEAMASTFLALVDPGDEVIILEPFYENYGPDAILADAAPVFVPLEPPNWRLDPDRLRAAFTPRTKAIIVNTPHNPTGRVLSREELSCIAELCVEHDVWAFTDEIYEHIRYVGEHRPLMTWPGMRERTVTISGLSKTYSCTGWRLGYAIAPERASQAIRKVHDFLTVGAAAPLQAAGAVGMAFDASYYEQLARDYVERRDLLAGALAKAGFTFTVPEGAYYILADFSALSDQSDTEFAAWMTREVGVAAVPGSSFYHEPSLGRSVVRFAFCKRRETLAAAAERLAELTRREPRAARGFG